MNQISDNGAAMPVWLWKHYNSGNISSCVPSTHQTSEVVSKEEFKYLNIPPIWTFWTSVQLIEFHLFNYNRTPKNGVRSGPPASQLPKTESGPAVQLNKALYPDYFLAHFAFSSGYVPFAGLLSDGQKAVSSTYLNSSRIVEYFIKKSSNIFA